MNLIIPIALMFIVAFGVGWWRVGARKSARIVLISSLIVIGLGIAFFIWVIVALSMSPTNWPN